MCKPWKTISPTSQQKILFSITLLGIALIGGGSLGCIVIPVEGELGIKVLFKRAGDETVKSQERVRVALAGFMLGGLSIVISGILLIVALVATQLNRTAMIIMSAAKALMWLVAFAGFLAASCIPKKKPESDTTEDPDPNIDLQDPVTQSGDDCASWIGIYIAAGLAVLCFIMCNVLLIISWLFLRPKGKAGASGKDSSKKAGWEEVSNGVFYNHDNGEYKGGIPGKYIINKDGSKTYTTGPGSRRSRKSRGKSRKSGRSKSRKSGRDREGRSRKSGESRSRDKDKDKSNKDKNEKSPDKEKKKNKDKSKKSKKSSSDKKDESKKKKSPKSNEKKKSKSDNSTNKKKKDKSKSKKRRESV